MKCSLEKCSNCAPEWKWIPGYEGIYKVSCQGDIYSTISRKNLAQIPYRRGYVQVGLKGINGQKEKKMKVHRAVAMAFIPNPENKPQVNHIDENKRNNCLYNLEWVTQSENMRHGTLPEKMRLRRSRPIVQKDKAGNVVKVWQFSTDLKNEGFERKTVWACCNGRRKTHKGFIWNYLDKEQR